MQHLRYVATTNDITSYSRLFPYTFLFFSVFGILAVLFFLFPQKTLIKSLVNQQYISEVDYLYSLLIIQKREQSKLYPQTIKQQPALALGRLKENLEVLKNSNNINDLWLNYIVLKVIAFDKNQTKEVNNQAQNLMSEYLAVFEKFPNTNKQLKLLAKDALAIQNSRYALNFYEQIIKRNPNQPLHFYTNTARVAVWAKACEKSASLYLTAKRRATTLEDKRYLYFSSIKALVQCDKPELAMTIARQNIEGLNNDPDTYLMLVNLAVEANQVKMAEQFMLKFLELKTLESTRQK